MMIEEVLNYFGSITNLVRKTKIGYSSYQYWKKIGCIPIRTQAYLEVVTGGELKADSNDYDIVKKAEGNDGKKSGSRKVKKTDSK